MIDPVMTPAGHSYERRSIIRWIEQEETDPMTREPLAAVQLIENRKSGQIFIFSIE
jgi:STIP1 family protein 1